MRAAVRVILVWVGLVVASAGVVVSGQEPVTTPAVSYSESVPYKPRLFRVSSSKKDKTDSGKKGTTDLSTAAPITAEGREQMPSNGPAVKEELPITIPVSVFNLQGNLVKGLRKEDFKVFVDGPEASVVSVEPRSDPLNVVIVLDTSASNTETLETARKVAYTLVDQFAAEPQIMVFGFDDELTPYTQSTTGRDAAKAGIKKLKPGNGTSLYDATKKLFGNIVPKLEGRTIVFLITDGVDTTSKTRYSEALVTAEQTETTVFPIYMDTFAIAMQGTSLGGRGLPPNIQAILGGNSIKPPPPRGLETDYQIGRLYLNDLVYLSGGRAVESKTLLEGRNRVVASFADEFRARYYVTFQPVGSAHIGQRKHLKVRVDRPNLAVVARGSYVVGKPPSKVAAP